MPAGHTDKATINERKPLTPYMRSVLRQLADPDRPRSQWTSFTTGEKNIVRALANRGLATTEAIPKLTEAGRKELAKVDRRGEN